MTPVISWRGAAHRGDSSPSSTARGLLPPERGWGASGFTLIELVLTIILLGIIAAAVSPLILQGIRSASIEQNRGDVHAQARLAVERVAREARAVRSCAEIVGPANPSAGLSFTDTSGAPVVFSLAGGNLSRGGDLLAQGVISANPFRFLKRDAVTETTSCVAPDDIWFIEIDLTCVQAGENLHLRTLVHPRNFP